MDERTFDALSQLVGCRTARSDLTRALAGRAWSRRLVSGGIVAAALRVLLSGETATVEAKKKKKKRKGGGGKPKPQPESCKESSQCGPCELCDADRCVKNPARENFRCGECGVCRDGRCVPDPRQANQECFDGSCKRCKADGTCGRPDDGNCEVGQICRSSDGRCAVPCLEDGSPCAPHHVCIDDGIGGAKNRCCLVKNEPGQQPTNVACGDNGDGTFRQCCSGLTERCCEDSLGPRCINKAFCCVGEMPCNGDCCTPGQKCIDGACATVCPDGRQPCDGVCCAEDEVCNVYERCENFRACPKESCTAVGLKCCPPNSFTTASYCCNPTDVCKDSPAGCCPAPCNGVAPLQDDSTAGQERRSRTGNGRRRRGRG